VIRLVYSAKLYSRHNEQNWGFQLARASLTAFPRSVLTARYDHLQVTPVAKTVSPLKCIENMDIEIYKKGVKSFIS
jgi:hypothetical protein